MPEKLYIFAFLSMTNITFLCAVPKMEGAAARKSKAKGKKLAGKVKKSTVHHVVPISPASSFPLLTPPGFALLEQKSKMPAKSGNGEEKPAVVSCRAYVYRLHTYTCTRMCIVCVYAYAYTHNTLHAPCFFIFYIHTCSFHLTTAGGVVRP